MISVPEPFAAETIRREGKPGRDWLGSLPRLIEDVCGAWSLEIDGPALHGVWGLVFAVRGAEAPSVLKVTYPDRGQPLRHVVTALSTWDGRGAVRLLRSDLERSALLLERLNPRATLRTLPIGEALAVAGALLRRLAVPAPGGFPRLQTVAKQAVRTLEGRWERLGCPMPRAEVERAGALAHALSSSTANVIVNWDLHFENVLAAEREPWLAIDPSVLSGDPEYALGQLLWWPLEEVEAAGGVLWGLDRLVEAGSFDAERARAWTYVRTVDYWLMGLENGLTIDPVRCQHVIEALDGGL